MQEHRRRRIRRHGRRAYIRSVYSLPSLATLGNAICGFGAIYLSAYDRTNPGHPFPFLIGQSGFGHSTGAALANATSFPIWFLYAAYLIFLAMVFDALDGRLARFTRHTTDFGGQLDSLADVISFGVAPAFLALQVFKAGPVFDPLPAILTRSIWAAGAIYLSCAAVRLARFNVSNQHGEQHHFSFLGLPSPGAAGAVAATVLLHQELRGEGFGKLADVCLWLLPLVVLITGLLMVSTFRYPHLVNRYLRGKRSIGRLLVVVALALLLFAAFTYTLAAALLAYSLWGPIAWAIQRIRPKAPHPPLATPGLP